MIVEKEKHICINCKFFLKGAHYDCRENIDELVKDKDRPNFCEYFALDEEKAKQNELSKKEKASSAEEAFNAFFNI